MGEDFQIFHISPKKKKLKFCKDAFALRSILAGNAAIGKCEFIPETDLELAQTQTWAPLQIPVVNLQ
jgi:hypothetical protein